MPKCGTVTVNDVFTVDDLVIEDCSIDDTTLQVGRNTTVSVTVRNDNGMTSDVEVAIGDGSTDEENRLGTDFVTGVAPDDTAEFAFRVFAPDNPTEIDVVADIRSGRATP